MLSVMTVLAKRHGSRFGGHGGGYGGPDGRLDAFGTLYAALSDRQKQVTDRLFRQQAEHQAAGK